MSTAILAIMPNNIILTGFMGSGKTTVGRLLSKQLGFSFIDTDYEIEQAYGISIPHIFAYGESYFRDIESEIIRRACTETNTVIATGGGAVIYSGNIALMRRSGIVFYLQWALADLYDHVKCDLSRPLLNVPNPLEEAKRLLSKREPMYLSAAHIIINCAGKRPITIANEIEGHII